MIGLRSVCLFLVAATMANSAFGHPHSGGIVVRADGTVVVGDILGRRLLVIEPGGRRREIADVGEIRGLAGTPDGTLYGVSWGRNGGVWKPGTDDRPKSMLPGVNSLLAAGEQGTLLLAPVDASGRGQRVEVRSPNGQQWVVATIADITAMAQHQGTTFVAAGSAIHSIDADGALKPLVENIGAGLYGLAVGPRGPIVAVYDERQVVQVAPDGARRLLLTSEPPWAPTDVAYYDGAVYVVELAQHPCCWKGPRLRRLVIGHTPTTLLTIDDGNHFHISPGERPFEWLAGMSTVAMVVLVLSAARARRRGRRLGMLPTGPAEKT